MVKTNEDVAFAHESSEIVLWYFIRYSDIVRDQLH